MTVAVDISEYQPPVNDSYPHHWITLRACDGSYIDRNAHANLAWCVRAKAAGKIDGFGVYVVYRPGQNQTILRTLDTLGVPHDCVVMVDAESWGGQIGGNHSPELNALAVALSRRQESQERVWGYGNRSDLATLWPQRPAWLGVVVASYGGSKPTDVPNLVGWQYTDGRYAVAGLPSASAPFGPCDHNELYIPAQTGDDMSAADVSAINAHTDQALTQIHAWLHGQAGLVGQVVARQAALEAALAKAGTAGIDVAAVQAAAEAGAKAALASLTLKAS